MPAIPASPKRLSRMLLCFQRDVAQESVIFWSHNMVMLKASCLFAVAGPVHWYYVHGQCALSATQGLKNELSERCSILYGFKNAIIFRDEGC